MIIYYVDLILKYKRRQPIGRAIFFELLSIGVSSLLIFSWYCYAFYYNQENNASYFFLRAAPYWGLDSQSAVKIGHFIQGWLREYFYETGRHIIYISALLIIFPWNNKNFDFRVYSLYILSVFGCLAFFLLFYSQLSHHDYYIISILFIIPLTCALLVKKYSLFLYKKSFYNRVFQLLFLCLLIASFLHAQRRVNDRFDYEDLFYNEALYELNGNLSDYGINDKKFFLIPYDHSPNIILYSLGVDGWSRLNNVHQAKDISEKISAGASYMVLSDKHPVDTSAISQYIGPLKLDYKGVKIFDLVEPPR
jgi:hypothetical protein